MPVTLISEDERNRWTSSTNDAGFVYRRPTIQYQRELSARHTKKGVTDENAVVAELLEWSIIDWFGFVNTDGSAVPFAKKYINNGTLPELFKAEFVTNALYAYDPEKDELGN
jgi:hypothetical protein